MSARILIIEDNPANLDLMSYLLQAFGHTTLSAPDGEQGLTIARRERPDLIICDIQLPTIDGFELARQLAADRSLESVPLVAVTALAMVGDRDRVLSSGFDGYISKPIDPETFVGQVERFLDVKTGHGQRVDATTPGVVPRVVHAAQKATKGTILVVDDLPVNLSLKRSILEPMGYNVVTAGTMAEALQLARQEPPILIVSDLQMADGDGFDFIKAVKAEARLAEVPFIFVTSTFCDEETRAKGLALGALRFLFRPMEPEALVAEIRACLKD